MNSALYRLTLTSIVLISLAMTGAIAQAAGQRYALVIGNGAYKGGLAQLKNSANDARDVAAAFKRLGYKVELLVDADEPSMEAAAVRLAESLGSSPQATGVFYYAGHGVQSQGVNYLIPVGANIPAEAFLKTKALSAQTVLDLMQGAANKLNLVILDACRDNPFAWSRSAASRGLSVVGSQPPGSIIVFATSAGGTAQDGTGRNGLFTQELLKNLETPGLDLDATLNRTAAGVQKASGNRQNPAIYKQFFGTAFLGSAPSGEQTVPAQPAVVETSALDVAPTMTIQKSYGSLGVSAAVAGALYLDGAKLGDLPASSKATLNNIATGARSLELRYADGRVEQKSVVVLEGKRIDVSFSGVSAAPSPPPQSGALEDNFIFLTEFNGHRYYLSREKKDWERASAICQQYGGHLCTITAKEENTALCRVLKTPEDIWIGLTDGKDSKASGGVGTWGWITGEKREYLNWGWAQPDNYLQVEHRGQIWSKADYLGWNDNNGTFLCRFLLEVE
jgi:hypothetical protein